MSGFAGFVCTQGEKLQDEKSRLLLDAFAGRLRFRGPDGVCISTHGDAGFCFTLLRTGPAPQEETQPASLDGRLWLLGDVRLDGRDELLTALRQHGDTCAEDASSEALLLGAWARFGAAALERVIGDFSFAIWDAEEPRLYCARDFFGLRQFFYAQQGGVFFFSNSVDALRAIPDFADELDDAWIGDFLLEAFPQPGDRTVYRRIRRLPAGHLLEFANGRASVRRFMELPCDEPLYLRREEEYCERYRGLLQQAVADRMPRSRAGIFLSGGLDSGTVAAAALSVPRASPQSLHAVTVDCRELFDDEEPGQAAQTAKYLGISHELLNAAGCEPFAGCDGLSLPEPLMQPFFALQGMRYRKLGPGIRVALSGDGGDGVLTGQSWPYLLYLARRFEWGRLLRSFGGYAIANHRLPPLRGGFRGRLRSWLRPAAPEDEYPAWLNPEFERRANLRERWRELHQPHTMVHPFHPNGYSAMSSGFWNGILEKEDPAWTGEPVQLRAPLLDLRLVRFLLRVPPVPLCINKELVRRAMAERLPAGVLRRPKRPLQGDMLLACAARPGFDAGTLLPPVPALQRYVDEGKVRARLAGEHGPNLWRDLRPVALAHWLARLPRRHSRD